MTIQELLGNNEDGIIWAEETGESPCYLVQMKDGRVALQEYVSGMKTWVYCYGINPSILNAILATHAKALGVEW